MCHCKSPGTAWTILAYSRPYVRLIPICLFSRFCLFCPFWYHSLCWGGMGEEGLWTATFPFISFKGEILWISSCKVHKFHLHTVVGCFCANPKRNKSAPNILNNLEHHYYLSNSDRGPNFNLQINGFDESWYGGWGFVAYTIFAAVRRFQEDIMLNSTGSGPPKIWRGIWINFGLVNMEPLQEWPVNHSTT